MTDEGETRPLGTCWKEGATARITTGLKDQKRTKLPKNFARHENENEKKTSALKRVKRIRVQKEDDDTDPTPPVYSNQPIKPCIFMKKGESSRCSLRPQKMRKEQVSAGRKKQTTEA
jgi:hypothetical protein